MRMHFFVICGLVFCCFSNAMAGFVITNSAAERKAAQMEEYNTVTPEEAMIIQTLENDINILNEEIKKCEKAKKGWTAATVIGSVGTAATGIAAIVQAVQIDNKKDELKQVKQETKELKAENDKAKASMQQ